MAEQSSDSFALLVSSWLKRGLEEKAVLVASPDREEYELPCPFCKESITLIYHSEEGLETSHDCPQLDTVEDFRLGIFFYLLEKNPEE